MRPLLLCLFALLLLGPVRAAEPFFKKGDVIALVGGEDMVVASEYGYLELLLTRALPDYHLRFRNLAWEGDTVFEQRRDLNFPTYEEQLDKIGATVVIAQFGQMESLAGKEKLPDFIAAYEKLIERFSGGGKRRVVILAPIMMHEKPRYDGHYQAWPMTRHDAVAASFRERTASLANHLKLPLIQDASALLEKDDAFWRDGCHLSPLGHHAFARQIGREMEAKGWISIKKGERDKEEKEEGPRQLIIAKNRLWFDYWRPQNWAFLAGDRTAQPSSRDHLDPSKRWFPPEREAFLPLIEAKEKEIDALAAQLAAGK